MGSENYTPRLDLDAEPCHQYGNLYHYFMGKPTQSPASDRAATPSSSSGTKTPLRSMLVTGFTMRNWDSLHKALLDDEQRRQMLIAKYDKAETFECESLQSLESQMFSLKSRSKSTVTTKESEVISAKSPSLEYLMGLAKEDEAYEEMLPEVVKEMPTFEREEAKEIDRRVTAAMRQARKYLGQHKIFEFFNFLISHMLSELPENPIDFLINLLDRCLLYRSGFGNPPLLFEKRHIEQLFNLMDRMRTGFIDVEQYETGLKTLGISSFDKNPPLSTDGMVPKDFFIEEAYECLTDLFVEMIRHRGDQMTPLSMMTPPPTAIEPSIVSGGQ